MFHINENYLKYQYSYVCAIWYKSINDVILRLSLGQNFRPQLKTSVEWNACGARESKALQTDRQMDGQRVPYATLCFAGTTKEHILDIISHFEPEFCLSLQPKLESGIECSGHSLSGHHQRVSVGRAGRGVPVLLPSANKARNIPRQLLKDHLLLYIIHKLIRVIRVGRHSVTKHGCNNNFSHIHRVIYTICSEWPACHTQGGGW